MPKADGRESVFKVSPFNKNDMERRELAQLSPPKRFYSIDVMRGIAALSVVLWHWQHFFLPLNKQGVTFIAEKQPMFDSLYFLYQYGYKAVELFFCLSGFIFFWLYSKRIAEKEISFKSFSILRLSRLYPLHFLTLLFVWIVQIIYMNKTNTYFTYLLNDAYHFFLNLTFTSSWGFEKGRSFNFPIWSVSIEVLLYAIFYMFCRLFNRNTMVVIIVIMFGHFIMYKLNDSIASGVECFFLGGFIFNVYERILKNGDSWKLSIWLPILASISWIVTIVFFSYFNGLTKIETPWLFHKIISVWTVFVVFPLTIISLALIETKRGTLGKRLSFIGDISYSSYLIHFPLQLFVAILTVEFSLNQEMFYSLWFIVSFYLALIFISLASHKYFELPIQRLLRLRYISSIDKGAVR